MPSTYRKVLNQGTSNPIVARTTVQPDSIMESFPITRETKGEIFSVNISLCQRLLGMEEFTIWLANEIEAIKSEFIARGLKQVGDDTFEAPLIIDLENRAESYLQAAKLCVRDCGLIFGAIVGVPFDHKFHKIVKWAENKFGKQDDFVVWLSRHELWVKPLLDMRNALEHPTAASRGKLYILNVDFKFSSGGVSADAPQWHLSGEPPTSILIDAQNINRNLLVLAEEILAGTLEKIYPEIPVAVQEISEERRDPKCAVRLKLIPRGFLSGTSR